MKIKQKSKLVSKTGIILTFTCLLFCLGFRLYTDHQIWGLTKTPESESKLFVSFPYPDKTLNNDLPAGDPLSGSPTITVQEAMDSIFNDFNNIRGAYIQLVNTSDSDYSADKESTRTIRIENKSLTGTNGGQAQFVMSGSTMVGCDITLIDSSYESALDYIGVVTHELTHCLGLDHAQELTRCITSYFADDQYRLNNDDKMAIIFLYPNDTEKVKEEATLGLSCKTR